MFGERIRIIWGTKYGVKGDSGPYLVPMFRDLLLESPPPTKGRRGPKKKNGIYTF